MVFKQTGTFIGYESYYQKDEGGGMKSRWLFIRSLFGRRG